VNYFFHDEPAKVLANVHELTTLEAIIRGITLEYLPENIKSSYIYN